MLQCVMEVGFFRTNLIISYLIHLFEYLERSQKKKKKKKKKLKDLIEVCIYSKNKEHGNCLLQLAESFVSTQNLEKFRFEISFLKIKCQVKS